MPRPNEQDEDRAGASAGAEPPAKRGFLNRLGPGLITGAADDDPSGIATY
ncbi:divalent metal cation transporter, partial [Xylella fastidiosa subsp. multiplex]|nr:divalent metal cation transporter [Xylella fastidiosa subsp. multiplex]